MPVVLNGNALANRKKEQLKAEIAQFQMSGGKILTSAVILVDDDPKSPSSTYVKLKKKFCNDVGIPCKVYRCEKTISEIALLMLVASINKDPKIGGVMVQLPLPGHINQEKIIEAMDPNKDMDGMHSRNLGLLQLGHDFATPCAAAAVMELLAETKQDLKGKRAVVIGCSPRVGDVVAFLLKKAGVTVTCIDIDGSNYMQRAVEDSDIVVTATGRYYEGGLVKSAWLRAGCIVIDVATHKTANGLRGDVDLDALKNDQVGFITSVPGGVGPVTVAKVAENAFALSMKTFALQQTLNKGSKNGMMLHAYRDPAEECAEYKRLRELDVDDLRRRSASVPVSLSFKYSG